MSTLRQFEIVYLLLNKKTVTAKELAEHFEVSTRTILRDIDVLSAAGIPVYSRRGREGGISLLEGFTLDKSVMTAEEKAQIISNLKAVAAVRPDENRDLLNKLDSFLGEETDSWLEIDFGYWTDNEKESQLFFDLKEAIIKHVEVRFDYVALESGLTKRKVQPLKLIYKLSAWYLYAYCLEKQDYRFFKLNRITNLIRTTKPFVRSAPESALKESPYNPDDKYIDIKLRIDKSAAFRALDDFGNCEVLPTGDVLIETQVLDTSWLVGFLMSYGNSLEIIEPVSLREQLLETIESIKKLYTGD